MSAQAQALLDLVGAERERRCSAELDAARVRARSLLRDARSAARHRLQEAAAAERARLADSLAAAQARLDTARRAHERRRAVALLAAAWPRLPGALRSLWQQPAPRAAWTRHLAEAARRVLPAGGWRIEHPPCWDEAERQAFAACCAGEIEFAADAGIEAGLRIRRGGNRVDGTLQALLADRHEIEARLLVQLSEDEPVSAPAGPRPEGQAKLPRRSTPGVPQGGAANNMERAQPANDRHPLPREGGRGEGSPP